MDSSKRFDDNGGSSEESGLKSSMFSRRSLTVVFVSYNHPFYTGVFIGLGNLGHTTFSTSVIIFNVVNLKGFFLLIVSFSANT